MCTVWSAALACALPDGGPCGICTHLASRRWTTEALARTSCSFQPCLHLDTRGQSRPSSFFSPVWCVLTSATWLMTFCAVSSL